MRGNIFFIVKFFKDHETEDFSVRYSLHQILFFHPTFVTAIFFKIHFHNLSQQDQNSCEVAFESFIPLLYNEYTGPVDEIFRSIGLRNAKKT